MWSRNCFTLPEYLSSSLVFSWAHVAKYLVSCIAFCRLLFVLLSFFLLVILLSFLLWITTSDYPFWYFQTFHSNDIYICIYIYIYISYRYKWIWHLIVESQTIPLLLLNSFKDMWTYVFSLLTGIKMWWS